MPSVIKAADATSDVASVVFNFDDLAVQGEAYLRKIRAQAEKIVAQAAQEAVAVRQRAEAEGRQAGMKAVESMVDEKIAQRLETVLPALRTVLADVERSKQGWLAHWEREAVHLASAMAARVCRRELERQPEIPVDLVREALELVGTSSRLRVALNPDDHAALGKQVQRVVAECSRLATTEIVADPQITRGGCRIDTDHGLIDQQFESQLERIEEELV